MPEAPEIKLTTEYLSDILENKIIVKFSFISGQYSKYYPENYKEFCDSLPLMVEEIECKGKLIYLSLCNENKRFFIIHNMRSGSWRNKQDSKSRWVIELDNEKKIWFHDSFCLSTLKFTTNEDELCQTFANLGPDILSNDFTLSIWKKLINTWKNMNISSFLMNQNIISGCGNYIKNEALYYAKIFPMRNVESLTETESEKLYEAIRIISRFSYINGGLSIDGYTDPDGKEGSYKLFLKIYDNYDATVLETPDGRITFCDCDIQRIIEE